MRLPDYNESVSTLLLMYEKFGLKLLSISFGITFFIYSSELDYYIVAFNSIAKLF